MKKLLVVAVVAVAAGAIWWTRRTPAPPAATGTELERPPVAAEAWTAYQAMARAPLPVADDRVAQLVTAFERANRAEAEGAGEPTAAAVQAAGELAEAAWQFAQVHTPAVYLAVGRQRGLALPERLEAALAWCREQGIRPADALAQRPWAPPVAALVDLAGPILRFVEEAGLVVDGRVAGAEPFVQAVFMQHWIAPLRARMPLDPWLAGEERTWYLRWKVERQGAGPLDRRLAAADELAALPDYPADLNAGLLLLQAGRKAEAVERLRRSTHPRAAGLIEAASRP